MASEFKNAVTRRIADFLADIGIKVASVSISRKTFLPGILVESGRILVDETQLTYPGDLLHEAGHLAVSLAQPFTAGRAVAHNLFQPGSPGLHAA